VPTVPEVALLFDFDGTFYVGDLPILAFARHCAELLPDAAAVRLIDGIRYFLEGKTIGDPPPAQPPATDGFNAVELLAVDAGLSAGQIDTAYQLSRRDLAGSAFALDAPDGLLELLADVADAHVAVVTNAPETGVREVIRAIGAFDLVDEIITEAGKPSNMPGIIASVLGRLSSPEPGRLLAVGQHWARDLADAHTAGAFTALLDRWGTGEGSPDFRARTMADLVPAIRDWAGAYASREKVR
jgi:FMN phosphatase YigB (HAD superfamily)